MAINTIINIKEDKIKMGECKHADFFVYKHELYRRVCLGDKDERRVRNHLGWGISGTELSAMRMKDGMMVHIDAYAEVKPIRDAEVEIFVHDRGGI